MVVLFVYFQIMSKCTVVNMHINQYDICIGRGTKWGNPYSHLDNSRAEFKVSTRKESIEKYREYLLNNKELMTDLHELNGKILGCYCKPKSCHGDILAEIVNNEFNELLDLL